MQRSICVVLCDSAEGELPLRELRRRLGEPDRSNLRRAIRGLLEREILEETSPVGEPRVALTVWSYIGMITQLASPEGRQAFITGSRETERAAGCGAKTGRRRRQAGTGGGSEGFRHGHRSVHNRPLGETQRLVLEALHRHTRSPQRGLPVIFVRTIVDADRSNLRRAIRTLLLRRLIEELDDGRRIRLTPSGVDTVSGLY